MKIKIFFLSLAALIIFSCQKENSVTKDEVKLLKSGGGDPVIATYQQYGSIAVAPGTFVPSKPITNQTAIYLFHPNAGPYANQTVEIYRYTDYSDFLADDCACGPDFTLRKVQEVNYVYCEEDGGDCMEDEIEGHCILVFCDNDYVE